MSIAIDLKGKTALVTGGSRGIGAEVVRTLSRAGARCAFSYRAAEEEANALVAELGAAGAEARAFRCDLAEAGAAEQLVEEVAKGFGAPDILVANAGIWEPATLDQLDGPTLARTLTINVESLVASCRAAAPAMVEKGWGRIVLIGSTAGQRGEAGYSAYAASKGAVHLFGRSIGVELAAKGVIVNTVAPGWVVTDMSADVMAGEGEAGIAAGIPRGRVARPEDIAGPVLFLCSELCGHMVGSVLSVNGGSVMD